MRNLIVHHNKVHMCGHLKQLFPKGVISAVMWLVVLWEVQECGHSEHCLTMLLITLEMFNHQTEDFSLSWQCWIFSSQPFLQ